MTMILRLEDFEVVECVTHYYLEPSDGNQERWFWYCLTCDSGSNKRQRHPHGHKSEGDAAVGAKYHRNAKRMERQQRCWLAWWWKEIMTCTDAEYFTQLWISHPFWARVQRTDMSEVMHQVQADEGLWEYTVKLNPDLRRPVKT